MEVKEYIQLRAIWNLVYLKVEKRNETSVYCVPAVVFAPITGILPKRLKEYGRVENYWYTFICFKGDVNDML